MAAQYLKNGGFTEGLPDEVIAALGQNDLTAVIKRTGG